MKRYLFTFLVSAGLLCGAVTISAHHAAQAQFDLTKAITLEGTCSKMEWINPHSYLQLQVKDTTGKTRVWKFETVGPAALRRAGLARGDNSMKCDPLGGGDKYIARGFPARSGSDTALLVDLKMADGRIIKLLDVDEFQLPPDFVVPK